MNERQIRMEKSKMEQREKVLSIRKHLMAARRQAGNRRDHYRAVADICNTLPTQLVVMLWTEHGWLERIRDAKKAGEEDSALQERLKVLCKEIRNFGREIPTEPLQPNVAAEGEVE